MFAVVTILIFKRCSNVQLEGIFRSIRYIRIGSLPSTRVKLPHHEYCSTQSMAERALWILIFWRSDYMALSADSSPAKLGSG